MYSHRPQYILLAALFTAAHAMTPMVKLVDGTFAPLDLARRAPGGLPLQLVNHNDMSYLVSTGLHFLETLLIWRCIPDNGPYG
jgi:hypothetical protein